MVSCFVFFNDTATTEIYTLSLHDALPISPSLADLVDPGERVHAGGPVQPTAVMVVAEFEDADQAATLVVDRVGFVSAEADRKSTRLNSSHANISYAVLCLKKKKYKICQSQ